MLGIADDDGQHGVSSAPTLRPASGRRRSCRRMLAGGRDHRRLDAGRLHGRARISIRDIRAGAEGLGAANVGLPKPSLPP